VKARINQFLRFGLVGVFGFIIDAGLLLLLTMALGVNVYFARVFSFLGAALSTWLVNRKFTFSRQKVADMSDHIEYLRYLAVMTCGGAINFVTFVLAIHVVPAWKLYPIVPLAIGSLIGLMFNYSAARHFVFAVDQQFEE
jgi:putative flippase GtrA